MKKKYYCNPQLYKDYYKHQAGSGISGFHGRIINMVQDWAVYFLVC